MISHDISVHAHTFVACHQVKIRMCPNQYINSKGQGCGQIVRTLEMIKQNQVLELELAKPIKAKYIHLEFLGGKSVNGYGGYRWGLRDIEVYATPPPLKNYIAANNLLGLRNDLLAGESSIGETNVIAEEDAGTLTANGKGLEACTLCTCNARTNTVDCRPSDDSGEDRDFGPAFPTGFPKDTTSLLLSNVNLQSVDWDEIGSVSQTLKILDLAQNPSLDALPSITASANSSAPKPARGRYIKIQAETVAKPVCTCRANHQCTSHTSMRLGHSWCYVDSMESCSDAIQGRGGPWSDSACSICNFEITLTEANKADSSGLTKVVQGTIETVFKVGEATEGPEATQCKEAKKGTGVNTVVDAAGTVVAFGSCNDKVNSISKVTRNCDLVTGRYVRIGSLVSNDYLNLQEIETFGPAGGVLRAQSAQMSSVYSHGGDQLDASKCIDGNTQEGSATDVCHSLKKDNTDWIRLDFGKPVPLSKIRVTNRRDCCKDRIAGATVTVTQDEDGQHVVWSGVLEGTQDVYSFSPQPTPGPSVQLVHVLDQNHWRDGDTRRYYHVDCSEWELLTGTPMNRDGAVAVVYHYRKGKLLWHGQSRFWYGTKYADAERGCHGRREAGSAIGQFLPFDTLQIVPPELTGTFHGKSNGCPPAYPHLSEWEQHGAEKSICYDTLAHAQDTRNGGHGDWCCLPGRDCTAFGNIIYIQVCASVEEISEHQRFADVAFKHVGSEAETLQCCTSKAWAAPHYQWVREEGCDLRAKGTSLAQCSSEQTDWAVRAGCEYYSECERQFLNDGKYIFVYRAPDFMKMTQVNLKDTLNLYEYRSNVGGWGGECTCPDGAVYQVGDLKDACGSIACYGGVVTKSCSDGGVPSSARGMSVTCAQASDATVSFSESTSRKGEKSSRAECEAYAKSINNSPFADTSCTDADCAPQGCYKFTDKGVMAGVYWNGNKNGKCSEIRECIYMHVDYQVQASKYANYKSENERVDLVLDARLVSRIWDGDAGYTVSDYGKVGKAGQECWSNSAAACRDDGETPCKWCGSTDWYCCDATKTYSASDNCGNVDYFTSSRAHRCARKMDATNFKVKNIEIKMAGSSWQWTQIPFKGTCELLEIGSSTNNDIYCQNAAAAGLPTCEYFHDHASEIEVVKKICEARSDCGGFFDYSTVGGLRLCKASGQFVQTGSDSDSEDDDDDDGGETYYGSYGDDGDDGYDGVGDDGRRTRRAVAHNVWQLKRTGGTALTQFTERLGSAGGCKGKNEICDVTGSPCNSAKTRDMCAEFCLDNPSCISFEWNNDSGRSAACQLSASCVTPDTTTSNWELWRRKEMPIHALLKSGARCKVGGDKNLDYQHSAEACATRCRATDGCTYFISGTNLKAGECWQQSVYSDDCGSNGFESDSYNFFRITEENDVNAGVINLQEIEIFTSATAENALQVKFANQSSTQESAGFVLGKYDFGAANAIDTNFWSVDGATRTASGDAFPWLLLDLGEEVNIGRIDVTNRGDCCKERIQGSAILVMSDINSEAVAWAGTFDEIKETYSLFPEAGGSDKSNETDKTPKAIFRTNEFPDLEILSLSGTSLARLQDDTFVNLNGEKVATLDLSEPTEPPNASVSVDFEGFTLPLAAMLWYSNECPAGFYATSGRSARDDVSLCARCPEGTYKPGKGGFRKHCTPCGDGLVDIDKDPTTLCVKPAKFETSASWKPFGITQRVDVFSGETFNLPGLTYDGECDEDDACPSMRLVPRPRPPMNATTMFVNAFEGQHDHISYQLSFGSNGSPGKVFVDTETGDVLAQPGKVGSFTVSLNAIDAGGFETEVQRFLLLVSVRPDFQVVANWNPETAMASSFENTSVTLGATVSVPGPVLSTADLFDNPFDDDYSKIIFKLTFAEKSKECEISNQKPGRFLVDTSNGDILGETSVEGCFEMHLQASDGVTDIEVAIWVFTVTAREHFTVSGFSRKDHSNSSAMLLGGRYKDIPATFAVYKTYQFAEIDTIDTLGLDGEQKQTLVYTLNQDAPPGFLINTKTGFIQGRAAAPTEGWLELRAIATVNSKQEEAIVERIRIKAEYLDVENPSLTKCVKGQGNPVEDATRCDPSDPLDAGCEFDGDYSCACNPGFVGTTCELLDCDTGEISNRMTESCERCLFGTEPSPDGTFCEIQRCPSERGQPCSCSSEGNVTSGDLLSDGQVGRPQSISVVCTGLSYPSLHAMPPVVHILELRDLAPDLDPRSVYANLPAESFVEKVVVSTGSFLDANTTTANGNETFPVALASGVRTTSTAKAEAVLFIQNLPKCIEINAGDFEGALPPVAICNAGKAGSADCEPCPKGSFLPSGSSGNNISECKVCSAGGFYADSPGRVGAYSHCDGACSRCPPGTYSPVPNATSRDDCKVCPRGTDTNATANYRGCPCLPNFDRKDRYGECSSCAGNPGLNCTGDARGLVKGFWWTFGRETENPPGPQIQYEYSVFSTNLRLSPADTRYDAEYETFAYDLPTAYECPNKDVCLGGLESSCAVGSTGPLCAVCLPDYTKSNRHCRECPEKTGSSIAVAIVLIVVILVAIILLIRANAESLSNELDNKSEKSAASAAKVEVGGTAADDKVKDDRWYECRFMSVLKIVLGHTQVISLMSSSYIVKWPEAYEKLTGAFEASTSGPVTVARPECVSENLRMSSHGLMLFSTLGSGIFCLIVGVYYIFKRKRTEEASRYCRTHTCHQPGCVNDTATGDAFCGSRGTECSGETRQHAGLNDPTTAPTICSHVSKQTSKSGQLRKCKQEVKTSPIKYLVAVCILTVSLVFFLFYPLITTSTVQVLAPCRKLCVDENNEATCTRYLRADYSIDCDTPKHRGSYGWAMFCFLVFGIGAPAVVLYHLRKRMGPLVEDYVRAKYRKRMFLYVKDDGDLDADEAEELRQEFAGSGVSIEEHNTIRDELHATYQTAHDTGKVAEYTAPIADLTMGGDPILLGMSFFSTPYV